MRILVIGDSCLDIFRYGEVNRLAPEAPVPVIKPNLETETPGMAGNVVANLKSLGAEVDFITNQKEIRKIRYICSKYNYLLLRVDENDKCEQINLDNVYSILDRHYDAVVISDYCKGFLDKEDISFISENFKCPKFLDTKKIFNGFTKNIDFIKINHQEFENNKFWIESNSSVSNKIIVTRGKRGCDFQGKNYSTTDVPVKDVSGAGDTFLSGLVVEYIKTKNIEKAIKFAQECTTIVIQKAGVSTI